MILLSLMLLNFTLVIMLYQTLIHSLPLCLAAPGVDTVTSVVCSVLSACFTASLLVGTFSCCHSAADVAAETRRRLKHAAAEPGRQPRAPVLDRLQLTASGYLTLDRPAFFQMSFNLLSLIVILIQFAQSEIT